MDKKFTVFDLPKAVWPFALQAAQCVVDQKPLKIKYHGEDRFVEVHALGVTTAGNPCVRVFQGAQFDQQSGWKMLKIEDIESFEVIEDVKSLAPRPGFVPGDRGMQSIVTEIRGEPPS